MFIIMPMLLFLRDENVFMDPVWITHANKFERNRSKAMS